MTHYQHRHNRGLNVLFKEGRLLCITGLTNSTQYNLQTVIVVKVLPIPQRKDGTDRRVRVKILSMASKEIDVKIKNLHIIPTGDVQNNATARSMQDYIKLLQGYMSGDRRAVGCSSLLKGLDENMNELFSDDDIEQFIQMGLYNAGETSLDKFEPKHKTFMEKLMERKNPKFTKLAYKEEKKCASREICHRCGKKHGEHGTKVMVCTKCMVIGYCSKECQVVEWPEHKTKCAELRKQRIIDSYGDHPIPENYDIPRAGIILPPTLTGYHKEVLLHVAIWDLDTKMKDPTHSEFKDEIVRSIKYFFKMERLPGSVQSGLESGKMVLEGLELLSIGYPGVRCATNEPNDTFCFVYTGQSLPPKGYNFRRSKHAVGMPMDTIVQMEKEIERMRIGEGEKE